MEIKQMKIPFIFGAILSICLMVCLGTKSYAATLSDNGKSYEVKSTTKGEYHKLQVERSSFIGITAFGNEDGTRNRNISIVCLNRQKKAISPAYKVNVKKAAYFSLKQGTYYIKVRSSAPVYKIYATFQAVKDNSGSSMKKARTLKLGKETYGIIYNTDSQKKKNWYKFSLKKPTKVQLKIKKAGGKIGFQVQGPANASSQIAKLKQWKKVTLPAGNYYILLAKPGKTAVKDGGIYSILIK